MRILHVISNLDPAHGGPPIIAASLAAAQRLLGQEVHLASYQTDQDQLLSAQVPGFDAVHRHDLGRMTLVEKYLAPGASRALDSLMRKLPMDVLHLHNVWESFLSASGKVARANRVPYLVLLNGMLDPHALAQKALKKKLALTVMTRTMLNGAAAIHCGNADEAELIGPLKLRPRCVTIPNGIWPIPEAKLPPRGTFRQRYPFLGDDPFALFLGRLTFKKGLDLLIPLFERVLESSPFARLVIVGPDSTDGDAVRKLATASRAAERIHVLPPMYGQDKLAAFVDARCFVLPSRQEGFPVAVLEAVASGVPCLISPACHFPQVEQYGAGFVIDLNADDWVRRLTEIMGNSPRYLNMARAGVSMVEQHFTWPRVAARSIAIYEQILGQFDTFGSAATDAFGRRA